jgi:hypothetical protein
MRGEWWDFVCEYVPFVFIFVAYTYTTLHRWRTEFLFC